MRGRKLQILPVLPWEVTVGCNRRFSAIVLSDILVKIEICIPLELKSYVVSTGNDFKGRCTFQFYLSILFSAIVFLVIYIQWPMLI